MTRNERIEAMARAIFEQWEFQPPKPLPPVAWVTGGNSLKQDTARQFARAALDAIDVEVSMSDQHAKRLREAAEQIATAGHSGWGNTCTYAADHIDQLAAQLAAERARADAAVAEAAEAWRQVHLLKAETSGPDGFATWKDAATDERVRRVKAEAEAARLRAAGRALLACPHIAERDTDPDWVDAETEAAVAEMRDALKEEEEE